MPALSMGSINEDPVQIVRTIARVSQMLIELRDEFLKDQREDTLDQIQRRIEDLETLNQQLTTRREQDANRAN